MHRRLSDLNPTGLREDRAPSHLDTIQRPALKSKAIRVSLLPISTQKTPSNVSLSDSVAESAFVAQNTPDLKVKRTVIYAARCLVGWAQLGHSLGPGWLIPGSVVG